MRLYVDVSKAKGYLVAAASGDPAKVGLCRKELSTLLLPGQRSLHMKDENDVRKRRIADAICRLGEHGLRAVIYDAGRQGTEKERRARCLGALIEDIERLSSSVQVFFDRDESLLSWDRQQLIELLRSNRLKDRVDYRHVDRHQELLLALPDAVAWCWARGGDWRRRIKPIVTDVRQC